MEWDEPLEEAEDEEGFAGALDQYAGQTVRLWRAETGECVQALDGHSVSVSSVTFSPNAALVASASGDMTVRLWCAGTGECVQVLKGHSDSVSSVAFSPDAQLLAASSESGRVCL